MEIEPRQPVPVFPLPNVVLFPHAVRPAARLRAALPHHGARRAGGRAADRHGAAAAGLGARVPRQPRVPRPGLPRAHRVGRVAARTTATTSSCWASRGCGSARAVREFPYRAVRVEVLPEAPYTEDDPLVACERRELATLYRRLAGGRTRTCPMPFVALVNGVCMTAPLGGGGTPRAAGARQRDRARPPCARAGGAPPARRRRRGARRAQLRPDVAAWRSDHEIALDRFRGRRRRSDRRPVPVCPPERTARAWTGFRALSGDRVSDCAAFCGLRASTRAENARDINVLVRPRDPRPAPAGSRP